MGGREGGSSWELVRGSPKEGSSDWIWEGDSEGDGGEACSDCPWRVL